MRPDEFRKRLTASITALAVLFGMLLAFGIYETVRVNGEMEQNRASSAAREAIKSRLKMVQLLAEDNAYWDEAVRAANSAVLDEKFIYESWGVTTGDGANYDVAFIADVVGRLRIGHEDNRRVQFNPNIRFGSHFRSLIRQLGNEPESVAGLARDGDRLVLIGAANILPTSPELLAKVPINGPDKLVFVKEVSPTVLAEIANQMVVNKLRLTPKGNGSASMPITSAKGDPLGYLSWEQRSDVMVLIKRIAPSLIIGGLLLAIILIVVTSQASNAMRIMSDQALTDGLSGLPNRRALKQNLAQLKPNEQAALAFIDLDGFKAVNDNYGHEVGDRLIKLVSVFIQSLLQKNEIVARLGGDEFAMLVTGEAARERIDELAQLMLERFNTPFVVDDRVLAVGATLGLSSARMGELEASELMRRADVAMYSAKEAGKMRAFWFNETLDEEHAAMHRMTLALREALAEREFSVAYQPVVDVDSKEIVGVEALLRWTSPKLGKVKPDDFIPVAEESGLIDAIGLYVLRQACTEMRDLADLQLSVNVSAAQLRNPLFIPQMAVVLAETRFPAERLEIEITESYVIEETADARRILKGLKDIGVTIVLDDFGSGYASLGFLRQFAFAKIKIDRSLVQESVNDQASRVLIHSSVAAARAMGIKVTAEGIEDETLATLMMVAGCDEWQGWHFGKPMDRSMLMERLGIEENQIAA